MPILIWRRMIRTTGQYIMPFMSFLPQITRFLNIKVYSSIHENAINMHVVHVIHCFKQYADKYDMT